MGLRIFDGQREALSQSIFFPPAGALPKIELSYGRGGVGQGACQNGPFLGSGKGRCQKRPFEEEEEEGRAKIDPFSFWEEGEEEGSDPSVAFAQAPLLVVPLSTPGGAHPLIPLSFSLATMHHPRTQKL